MNRLSKLLLGILILLNFLVVQKPLQAITVETRQTGMYISGDIIVTTPDNKTHVFVNGENFLSIHVGNETGFCIEPEIQIGTGAGYSVSDFTHEQQSLFSRIIFHGWDMSAQTGEDYLLTQFAIWLNVPGYTFNGTEHALPDFWAKYNALMAKVANHNTLPSFHNQTITINENETIVLTDSNGVLSDSAIIPVEGFQIVKEGNSLSITALSNAPASATLQFKKFPMIESDFETAPLVYANPDFQDFIIGRNPDPMFSWFTLNVNHFGDLEIAKVDEQGNPIGNVIFHVSNSSDFSNPTTITTNEQGIGRLNDLLPGTYYVKEIEVPSPYVLDESVHSIEVLSYQLVSLNIENKAALGQLQITKTDFETGVLLENAQFELIDESGSVVDLITTNENGIGLSKVHPLGNYQLKEISAPQGYLLNQELLPVTLSYQDLITSIVLKEIDVSNEVIKGRIQIVKVDKKNEEKPIEGVVFEIRSKETNEVLETITTNQDGFATSSLLRYGEYVIKETYAPKQYALNPNEYPISIIEHDKTVVQYIANDVIEVRLKIQKLDAATKEGLAGAVFEVINQETGEVVNFESLNDQYQVVTESQLTTNELGQAFTRGYLEAGKYLLKEVNAPKGYLRSVDIEFEVNRETEVINLDVLGPTTVVEVSNDPTKIEILKVDQQFNPLQGAHLALYHDDELILEWVSTTEPVGFSGLQVHEEYTLVELNAPTGYLLSKPHKFSVLETSEIQLIQMMNYLEPIIKTQAQFENGLKESYSEQQNVVIDTVSLSNLRINEDYHLVGRLIDQETETVIVETELAFKAQESNESQEIVFEFNGDPYRGKTLVVTEELFYDEELIAVHNDLFDQNQSVYINDPQLETSASVSKRDFNNPMIFHIVDTVSYTDLIVGESYVISGYLMNKDNNEPHLVNGKQVTSETEFVASSKNGSIELSFEVDSQSLTDSDLVVFETLLYQDKPIATHHDINSAAQTIKINHFTLTKVDSLTPEKVLSYAEFELYQEDLLVDVVISDERGQINLYLEEGNWSIKERKAPEGYRLNDELIELNDELHLIIPNEPIIDLPRTGTQNLQPVLSVLGIIVISSGLYLLKKRKVN